MNKKEEEKFFKQIREFPIEEKTELINRVFTIFNSLSEEEEVKLIYLMTRDYIKTQKYIKEVNKR